MDTKNLNLVALAGGAAQPFILKEYVFKDDDPLLIPDLDKYGKTSSVVNMVAGGVAVAAALIGKYMHKGLIKEDYQDLALSYGVPALTVGLLLDYMNYAPGPETVVPSRVASRMVSAPRMVSASRAMSAPVVVTRGPYSGKKQETAERGVY